MTVSDTCLNNKLFYIQSHEIITVAQNSEDTIFFYYRNVASYEINSLLILL